MSETDIDAGSRWAADLAKQLKETNFGIVCLTPEALSSHWLLFEAGALSKSVDESRVCPYLIGIGRHDIQGPLAQFQSKDAVAEQTYQMLEAINSAMGDEALPRERLRRYFDRFWPELESAISSALRGSQYLPPDQFRRVADVLSYLSYDPARLEMWFRFSDLPMHFVNWNQPMVNVARDAVKVALEHNRLRTLLEYAHKDYEGNPELSQLLDDLPNDAGL